MYGIIIHMMGTSCSGKSRIIAQIAKDPRVKSWDITQFYNDNKIITNNEMNWINYENHIWKLKNVFEKFIKSSSNTPVIIIETIGWNEKINKVLSQMPRVINIILATPDLETLKKRLNQRKDIKEEDVMFLYNKFIKSELNNKKIQLQQNDAYLYIKERVNEYELELFKKRKTCNKNNQKL